MEACFGDCNPHIQPLCLSKQTYDNKHINPFLQSGGTDNRIDGLPTSGYGTNRQHHNGNGEERTRRDPSGCLGASRRHHGARRDRHRRTLYP